MPADGIVISGRTVAVLRKRRALTQGELATRIGRSLNGVQRIEGKDRANVVWPTARKLSEALGVTLEELQRSPGEQASDADGNSIDLPVYGSVSASAVGQGGDGSALDHLRLDGRRHFVLRVNGDCMEPDYHDGDQVIFDSEEVDRHGIKAGGDYAFHLSSDDARTTFKRVESVTKKSLVLVCINEGKHHKRITLDRSEIVRAGRALYTLKRSPRKG